MHPLSERTDPTKGNKMSDKIKRTLAALAALGALALGGAAIAGATSDGGSSDQATAEKEQADGAETNEAADAPDQPGDVEDGPGEQADGTETNESTDAPDQPGQAEDGGATEAGSVDQGAENDGELPAADEQKARAAAEQATGGKANGDVETAKQADPVEDPNDQPTPKGAAYEVEITKGGQALKVFLDSSFHEVETQQDAG